MPKVTMYYNPSKFHFLQNELHALGLKIRPLVATATSTEDILFTKKDIDWMVLTYPPGSIGPPLSIEIETFGFPSRKKKLNEQTVLELKKKILSIPAFSKVDPNQPLIWVKFQDPDDVHV